MAGLANKLQDLESCLKSPHSQTIQYGRALRDAIIQKDDFMEMEVLKSLGDLHLQKGKRSKDSAEFDKAAALYAVALLRCTDPDMGQTLEHRIGYMEKVSRQHLQGYSPHIQWWSSSNIGTADNNILRVAKICYRVDKRVGKLWHSTEEIYMETLVNAITNRDAMLELEILKSLGDLYLEIGKSRSDLSQLSKAAAMYNKSLAKCICEEHELKQTLHRRILYTERIREIVMRNLSKRPNGGLTEEDRQRYRRYRYFLKEGESSLASADLDSAEQHFAAALQAMHAHIGDTTAQQYQREVEPLCKLGDVYSKRGQQTGDGGDFVKAAALYNAAIARSEDQVTTGNIAKVIKDVEKSFLKYILGICHNVNRDDTEKHKKQLKEMRDQIKLEMETIDQQLDPYVHDEDDPCVKEIETKRSQAVRYLFEKIAQQRKEFINLLVEECIGLMGPPPCKYALIGLGSLATGLVTPYSDLEFAILVEEESEECLVYFRNLTHYLHLKVVNLGETILPALGIKSLNDFYSKNPLHNWYYDSVTPRGFAFDGSMPQASKTPLGRQGIMNQSPSELICTPENMVLKIKNDVALYLKEGYHLANILRNPCLIAGDQDLIGKYMGITENILQADWGKVSRLLVQQTLFGHIKSHSSGITNLAPAKLIDVKKDLYRFPVVAVDCMALSSGIIPTTVWETIEEMKREQLISSDNAHHLTVVTSISAELRLRTYIANGGQRESLSALTSIETTCHGQETSLHVQSQSIDKVKGNSMKPVFHLPKEKQLLRYYYTALPLKRILSKWPVQDPDFYDDSPTVRGIMYFDLCRYDLAIRYIEEALKQTGDSKAEKVSLLNNLAAVWHCRGEYKKAIDYSEHALQSRESICGHGTADPHIATSLKYLGSAWIRLEDVRKAIKYFEQELQMNKSIYGQSTPNPDIATSLNNLGGAWHKLGDYEKAIRYCRESLQMKRSIYGQSTAHPDTANSLNSMGLALGSLGDHRKAISYSEQALQMLTCIYGHNTAHPDIAVLLQNLGVAWDKLGDHGKATSYYEQALQMFKSVYSQTRAHPDIAGVLNSLGEVWYSQGDHEKAISYFDKAIQMLRDIYGQDAVHPHIAHLYENLGRACNELCDNERAIDYLENALQMLRVIHGKNTTHADIAGALVSLGAACSGFTGNHRKAIRCCEEAIRIHRSIHGPSVPSAPVAKSLFVLGQTSFFLGDFRKANSYFEEALQMYTMIRSLGEMVPTLGFQAFIYFFLKDYDAAFIKHNKALALARKINLKDKDSLSMHLMEENLSIIRATMNRKKMSDVNPINRKC